MAGTFRRRAISTLLALFTLLLWSFLAYLGSRLSHVPPFLLVGLALCVGGCIGLWQARAWRVPLITLAVGVGGIFGYHYLLFSAFQRAPAVEANLINYLWPLLIVLLSPVLLPGSKLGPHHWLGALVGMAGAGLIVTGGRLHLDASYLDGYALAAAAALTWACYSLLTKRLPPFPTGAVGGFCLLSGLLSLAAYFLTGSSAAFPHLSGTDLLFLLLLGAGPMGLAFFTWDAALKRGDPRVIGSLSYLTPLASTLILVVLGGRSLSWTSAAAMALIVTGSIIGALDLFRTGRKSGSAFRKRGILE